MVAREDRLQLRGLAALRGMMTQAAASDVGEALARERQAEQQVDEAEAQVYEAASRWQEHMSSSLLPELGATYAGQLLIRQARATTAAQALADARSDSTDRKADWRLARAAQQAAEKVAGIADRGHLNRREEAALQSAADRVTTRWRCP